MGHVFSRFAALGETAGFTIAQRRRGVTCAGLFARVRSGTAADLVALLDADFAGLFAPENLMPVGGRAMRDLRFGVTLDLAPQELLDERALLEAWAAARPGLDEAVAVTRGQLRDGRHVFVHASRAPLPDAGTAALSAALRRHGAAPLLLVHPGPPSLVEIAPEIFRGTIPALAEGEEVVSNVRVSDWEALCRQVVAAAPAPRRAAPRPATSAADNRPAEAPLAERMAAGLALHRAGRFADAAAAYNALLAREPEHPELLHLLGLATEAEGDADAAIALLRRAIAAHPAPRYAANLGAVLGRLGRWDEAAAAARAALAVQPDYPEALNTLAMALGALGEAQTATEAGRRAVALRPDYVEAHLNLGHALAQRGDVAGAVSSYRRAFALRPELVPSPPPGMAPRVLYVAADGSRPGAAYRCARMAEAARATGWQAAWRDLNEVTEADLRGLSVLVLWRTELVSSVARLIAYARAQGTRVGLDLDDLLVDPALARADVIDAIRTLAANEDAVRAQFERLQAALLAADFGIASTQELARAMRTAGRPVWVLPNGFDDTTHHAARRAMRARRRAPGDGTVRLVYAAGTRTHQRDMAVMVPALATALATSANARLVLFRDPSDGALVRLDTFPELARHADRVEWRDTVPLAELPASLADCDINLAPLEVGNPFCEAKSELKAFEAALAGLPTIASPTGPFRRAIRHNETGLLAEGRASWTGALLGLIGDARLRARLAEAAYHTALWRFGPRRRRADVAAMLEELRGTRAFAAGLFAPPEPDPPAVPPTEILFEADDGGDSAGSLVLSPTEANTSLAALEAVRAQTLRDLDLAVLLPPGATAEPVLAWLRTHVGRFHRATVRRIDGDAPAANAGVAWAETGWVLITGDASHLPTAAAATLLGAGTRADAGFAYAVPPEGARAFDPRALLAGNPIGDTVLLAKWAWAAAGGFVPESEGGTWALACALAELGVPGLALAWQGAAPPAGASPDAATRARVARLHPWIDRA